MFAYVKEYEDFSVDIDLDAERTPVRRLGHVGRPEVLDTSGDLALRLAGSGATVQLNDFEPGDVNLRPTAILASGTTVSRVRVWWSAKT